LYLLFRERSTVSRDLGIHAFDEVNLPMHILNQYSFVVIGSVVLFIVTLVAWRFVAGKSVVLVFGLVISLLVITQIYLSNRIDQFPNVDAFENALESGTPLVVALYSNY